MLIVEDLQTMNCPTLCDPMDCSLPGSSVHGILQARILEWVAISFPRKLCKLWKSRKPFLVILITPRVWTPLVYASLLMVRNGLPQWLNGKDSVCSAGAAGSVPGSGRSPGGGHGNPLQYSCLKNPVDRGAWQATVDGVTKSQTQLSD